jgi:branched-chain amino acid transport system ATP-binding protein
MPEPPLLVLHNLHKRFGGLRVTDDVSLTVQPNEIHAIIGPNGAGKTTLMSLIGGTIPPDSGSVLLAGRNVTTWSLPARARLGMARSFQITSIIPGFTTLENAAFAVQARTGSSFRFFRRARSDTNLNDQAYAALAQAGLADRANTIAAILSHGEKRQLELAIAIASRPRLLLLDEPLAGAGPEETDRLVPLLHALRASHGILLVEHDMQAVFALADRISVLVYGRIIATGDGATIRDHPDVRAAYLGDDASA